MGRTAQKMATHSASATGSNCFISRAGLEHLKKLRAIKADELEDIKVSIRAAAEDSKQDDSVRVDLLGDLHKIESSIQDLDREIKFSLAYEESPDYRRDCVGVGKLVTYRDGEGDKSEDVTIAILNPRERDIGRELIQDVCKIAHPDHNCNEFEIASCSADLAQGLMGKKVGDIAEVMLPAGRRFLKVLAVTRIFSE